MDKVRDRVRRDWWLLVVLVVTLLGTLHRTHEGFAQPNAWAGLLALAAVVCLFWRDQRPELVVLANAGALALYFAASPGFPDGPIYLSAVLSTFALVSRRPLGEAVPFLAVALGVILSSLVIREVRVDSSSTLGTVARLIWFSTVDTGSAALAVALRSRRETRTEVVRRAATEERLRMAQDLHDGVGHGLAVIAMQAGVALHVLDDDRAAARRSLEAIRDTSRESLDALRAELVRLSPDAGTPAPRAPRNGLSDLEVLAGRVRAAGVLVLLEAEPVTVPPDVDAVAYTVAQEALTNVLRHSGASSARVRVRRTDGHVEVTVSDDGHGPGAPLEGGRGMGIPSMRSRVEELGGTLAAGPGPGGGFVVTAVLPVPGGAA